MSRPTNITAQEKSSYALRPQVKLGQYDFPFTLNPTTGCFFGCVYCYSPNALRYNDGPKRQFFENVQVKLDKPEHLRRELKKYACLPQHLKRVQINETSEYYLPQVMKYMDENNHPDVMLALLERFRCAWDEGNRWMLHILTKSPLILRHFDTLVAMRHMVQVEVSFATHDEAVSRQVEFFTPTIGKRLELVKALADAGIFVRIMAMPFFGGPDDLRILKEESFRRGAKAFKNKGLNYYKDWADLRTPRTFEAFLAEEIPTGKGRVDTKHEAFIIKSGENLNVGGRGQSVTVVMPSMDENHRAPDNWGTVKYMKEKFVPTPMTVIDCGYRHCNDVNWGYIR